MRKLFFGRSYLGISMRRRPTRAGDVVRSANGVMCLSAANFGRLQLGAIAVFALALTLQVAAGQAGEPHVSALPVPPPEITQAAYPTIAQIDLALAERLFQRQPEAFGAVQPATRQAAEEAAGALLQATAIVAEERQAPYLALYVEALVALETGRIERAIDELRRAVAQRRDFAEAWVLLGTAYWQQARRDEATDAFGTAIELAPGLASARQGRALVLAADGGRRMALAELADAVCANPYDPFVRRNLILTAHRLGRWP